MYLCKNTQQCLGNRSGRNRTSRFISTRYLESYGRRGGGLCHNFVFLCHAYVSSVAQTLKKKFSLLSDKFLLDGKVEEDSFMQSTKNKTNVLMEI